MPILGFRRYATAGTPVVLKADHKYLTSVSVPYSMRVPKLSALVDGLAPGGTGDGQPLRGVIYDEDGALIAQSEEVLVAVGAAEAWVDLVFPDAGGAVLAEGDYELGIIAGGPATARVAALSKVGTRASGVDTYAAVLTKLTATVTLPTASIAVVSTTGMDPAGVVEIGGQRVSYTSVDATHFKGCSGGAGEMEKETEAVQEGAASLRDQPAKPASEEGELRIFATYFIEASVPDISDAQIARYPFPYAQSIFGAEPPLSGTSRVGSCTWHGTIVHPDRGSFAIVQRDGPLSELVGERVRVSTFEGREVFAYVIGEADLSEEDDISLTRRLFLVLAPLATSSLNARVEILSTRGEP